VLNDYGQIPGPEYKLMCPYFSQGWCGPVRLPPPGLGQSTHRATAGPGTCVPCHNHIVPTEPPVMSVDTVRVNGLDINPDRGAAFVLDQNDGVMASSGATIALLEGRLVLKDGRLVSSTFDVNGDLPLLDADLNALLAGDPTLASGMDLGGFKIGGTVTVDLVNRASKIGASLSLPASFTDSGGAPLTSQITLIADNQNGLRLDDVLVAVPSANFYGDLQFDQLKFCYQQQIMEGFCQRQTGADFGSFDTSSVSSWNATGDINLLGTDISAVPSMNDPHQGIGFVDGTFDFAGVTAHLPDPGIELGNTGVFLHKIAASLALNPTQFDGSINLTAAGIVSIDGAMFLVFASPDQPYTFTGNELGGVSNMPTPTVTGFAVAVGADVAVQVPVVGNLVLGSGYILYAFPGYLAAGGNVSFSLLNGDLALAGGVNGQFGFNSRAFDVEGNLHVHAAFLDGGADVVVSSAGIAGCGSVGTPLGDVTAGLGYHWGGGLSVWLGSCDLGSYRVTVPAASASARDTAAARYRLSVPAGLSTEMVKLTGTGGAPDVTITGPGGIHASTAGGSTAASKPFLMYRVAKDKTTYIAIIKPPAGSYTITANHGSPAITRVMHAQGISPSVRAHVVRRSGSMLLSYTMRRVAGQKVVFAERSRTGLHEIGSATAAKGSFRFTPAPGPAGIRQIVAEIVQNSAPVVLKPNAKPGTGSLVVVASYRAAGPRRLPKITGLRVRHIGTRVLVSFSRVRGASGYSVIVRLSSGEHLQYLVRRDRAAIPGVFGEITGKLAVRAVGNNATTVTGPAAIGRIQTARGD
jgi:hypothetical protein